MGYADDPSMQANNHWHKIGHSRFPQRFGLTWALELTRAIFVYYSHAGPSEMDSFSRCNLDPNCFLLTGHIIIHIITLSEFMTIIGG